MEKRGKVNDEKSLDEKKKALAIERQKTTTLKIISEGSAAKLIASQSLVRPPVPGLSRQPSRVIRTARLNNAAPGTTTLTTTAATATKRPSISSLVLPDASMTDLKLQIAEISAMPKRGKGGLSTDKVAEAKESEFNFARSSMPSLASSSSAQLKSSEGSRQSLTSVTTATGDEDEDDAWDNFYDLQASKSRTSEGDRPDYQVAPSDFNVAEAQVALAGLLTKMYKDGRLTDREKLIISDKYELLLQALVSFQEREVELIDHLNAKNTILDMLNQFTKNEKSIADHMAKNEESEEDNANVGKPDANLLGLRTLQTVKDEDDDGKKILALSVEEMSASALREHLLIQKNKLQMQEHMRIVLLLELKTLEFEKTLLSLHYSRMVKPNELDKELRELQRTVNGLEMEVAQIKEETAQLHLDIKREEKGSHEDESQLDKSEIDTLTKQMEVQTNSNKPIHIGKEADRIQHLYTQYQDEYDKLVTKYIESSELYHGFQSRIDKLSGDIYSLEREEIKFQQNKKIVINETEGLANQMETLLNREQALNDRIALVAEKLSNTLKTRKELTEEIHIITNQSSKANRDFQKLDRAIRVATESHLNAKLAYDKMKTAFETSKPRDGGNWEKLIQLFSKEIGNLKVILNRKIDEATVKSSLVKKLQKKLNEVYEDQLVYGKELQDLIRTTVRKRRERQDKSEQCIKLESQIFRLVQDKKMQQLVLSDCSRVESDLIKFMEEVKKSYNQTKIERSNLMSDVIKARQRITEQEEKLKIATNEIESLNKRSADAEIEIHRAHFVHLNTTLGRDMIQNSAIRSRDKFRVFRDKKLDLAIGNKTLKQEIEKMHLEAFNVRQRFDSAVNRANSIALKVRERIEEICTIIEKTKQEENWLLKAKGKIFEKEEEQALLFAKKAEVQKHLLIVISIKPDQGKILKKIDTLREELEMTTRERICMEKKFHDSENPERVRELNFDLLEKKETVPKLECKLQELEEELALKECMSIERDLIIKQLDQVTKESMEQASNLKTKFQDYVRQLVDLRKNLAQVNFKINGMICETSIAIAQAETEEQKYIKMKSEVEESERRLELGLAPSIGMVDEWKKISWRNEMMCRTEKNKGQKFLCPTPKPNGGAKIFMDRYKVNRDPCYPTTTTCENNKLCDTDLCLNGQSIFKSAGITTNKRF